jgi:hypothetical protein
LEGVVTFGRCSDGRHGALHLPAGGMGNLRVHGMANWCHAALLVGIASAKISDRCSDFLVGAGALCLNFLSPVMLKFVCSMDHGRSVTRFALLPRMLVLMPLTCTQKRQLTCTHDADLHTKNINHVDKKNLHLRLMQGHNFYEGKTQNRSESSFLSSVCDCGAQNGVTFFLTSTMAFPVV